MAEYSSCASDAEYDWRVGFGNATNRVKVTRVANKKWTIEGVNGGFSTARVRRVNLSLNHHKKENVVTEEFGNCSAYIDFDIVCLAAGGCATQ